MKEGFFFPTPQTRLEQRPSLYEQGEVCLQHSSPLQLICLSCSSKLLCSQCLQLPVHSGHEVRSIDRARQIICSQYQQWMVRLSSKSEILDIIHGQFENNKSEISLFAKKYKEKLALEFEDIMHAFEGKLHQLQRSIDVFIRQYIFQMSAQMERIRSQRKEIEKVIAKYDKERIELVSLPELAAYSYQIRNRVGHLLDESEIADYKERLAEPEWKLSNDHLQDIRTSIDSISINFKDTHQRETKDSHLEQDRPKKKNKKDLKIFDANQRERSQNKLKQSASSNVFAQTTLTPKNKSKERKVKQKRSPEVELLKKRKKSSAKMISMPASPAKEVESTYLITPELSRKKLFKKK